MTYVIHRKVRGRIYRYLVESYRNEQGQPRQNNKCFGVVPELPDDAPIGVVLFAGGGGVEAEMIMAGIRPVLSVEFDPTKPEFSRGITAMKSNRELLSDYLEMVGEWNRCLFKLRNGRDCDGEIGAISEKLLQFYPHYNYNKRELWESCKYEKNYEDDKSIWFIQIPLRDIDLNNLFYWNAQSSCWMNPRWNIEQECWIHNETTPGSIPLPDWLLKDAPGDDSCLKKVGYWQSEDGFPYFPHPKYLVEPEWRESERDQIIAYLRAGHGCGYWWGYSYCRFGCFSCEKYDNLSDNLSEIELANRLKSIQEMGCRDLTDGEWVWPEGLAHYVEKHNVCLPNLFISTMQKNSWLVPQSINFQDLSQVGVCSSYWVKWTIEYTRTKQK